MIMLSEWCRPSVCYERLVSNSVLYTTDSVVASVEI